MKSADEIIEQKICSTNYKLLNSARSGLSLLAQHLDLPKDKRIGIPAFSCVVMAAPFCTAGYEIEWIDTDEHGLIDVDDFEAKAAGISLVILPHIWGQEAPVKAVVSVAKQYGIVTVEDCAHLWSTEALEADFRIYSFGREKVLSCVSGGALCQREVRPDFDLQALTLAKSSWGWTLRHALQPCIFSLSLGWWFAGGKYVAGMASKLRLLPRAVSAQEKQGQEDMPIASMPVFLRKLLAFQIQNVGKQALHAEKMSKKWAQVLSTKFPQSEVFIPKNNFRVILKTKQKSKILQKAAEHRFVLEEWNGVPFSPKINDKTLLGYEEGQCPKAEEFARSYITFPTNKRVTSSDIDRFDRVF